MSRALLAGTAGGIVGAVTAANGILWSVITSAFLTEISSYLTLLGLYLTTLSGSIYFGDGYIWPLPLPYFPSASLFSISSFILSIFLTVTGILVGTGFYGAYKIGGGARGLAVLIFGIIGTASSALLIIMGNLTTGYMNASFMGPPESVYYFPVPTPNFPLIWIGFMILALTLLVLGSASRSVSEATEEPFTSSAAGALSIMGAVVVIISILMGLVSLSIWPTILVISFGVIGIAFILWASVFYSFRDL